MADEKDEKLRDRIRHGHLRSRLHNGFVQFIFGVLAFGILPFGFALAMTLLLMGAFHAFSINDRFAEIKDRSGVINQVSKISLYISIQIIALLVAAWTGLTLGGLLGDGVGWLTAMAGF